MKLEINDEDGIVTSQVSWEEDSPTPLAAASSKDILDHLKTDYAPSLGLLPPAVRWMDNTKKIVIFERPPMMQTLSYYPAYRDRLTEGHKFVLASYTLPVPWTVYAVQFDTEYNPLEVRVFARKEQINSMDDRLFLLPILNLYSNGAVCNPSYAKYEEREPTMATGLQEAYNIVWNSGFNFDLRDAANKGFRQHRPFPAEKIITRNRDSMSGFYTAWSKHTIEDALEALWPMAWFSQDGSYSEDGDGVTIENLIDYIKYKQLLLPQANAASLMARLTNVIMASTV